MTTGEFFGCVESLLVVVTFYMRTMVPLNVLRLMQLRDFPRQVEEAA